MSAVPNTADPLFEIELRKRADLRDDFLYYAENCLFIRTKRGGTERFRLNRTQQHLHRLVELQKKKTGKIRALVLKGRQQGISTYVEGRFYWRTSHRKGVRAFILTHEDPATQNLFGMAERYHSNCPEDVRPRTGASNAKELKFELLDSEYKVGTAGTKGTGRSSTIHYFHGSEVAFWPHADTHAMGAMQAVPREDDTEVFLESTANGIGNYFHAQWVLAESGESDYIPIFLPWYWADEYRVDVPDGFVLLPEEAELLELYGGDGLTIEHLAWRRLKTAEFTSGVGGEGAGEWKFRQEYPFNAAEAFQTSGENGLISPESVMRARKAKVQAVGAKIVGVDPARFGKDRTAIVFRQGRVAGPVFTYTKRSTMDIVAICANLLRDPRTGENTQVSMMFIDEIGIGAGIIDRLRELGFEDRIMPVNAGGRPLDRERFVNKRAECWWLMNEWLGTRVAVPDRDDLQADLCGPMYFYDSSQRVYIERKEKMMERGLPSPDIGDALAMTFAFPVQPGWIGGGKGLRQPLDPEVNY